MNVNSFVFVFISWLRVTSSYQSQSIGIENDSKFVYANEEPVFCRVLERVYRFKNQVESPIPNRVLIFHSSNSSHSPLLNQLFSHQECKNWANPNRHHWLHNRNSVFLSLILIGSEQDLYAIEWNVQPDLKGTLLVAECSEEIGLGFPDCRQFFRLLARLNLYQQEVTKRFFSLLFVYQSTKQESLSYQIVSTFLQEPDLAKMHSAVVVFDMKKRQKNIRLLFSRISFIRPLKNVCFVESDYLEDPLLDEMRITRHLLAIDSGDRILKCDFQYSLLKFATNMVWQSNSNKFFYCLNFYFQNPLCEYEVKGNEVTKVHPSIDINLILFLAEQFHFRYHLRDNGADYGTFINNTWTGIIGNLLNQVSVL